MCCVEKLFNDMKSLNTVYDPYMLVSRYVQSTMGFKQWSRRSIPRAGCASQCAATVAAEAGGAEAVWCREAVFTVTVTGRFIGYYTDGQRYRHVHGVENPARALFGAPRA